MNTSKIEVINEIDSLTREVYEFYFFDDESYLVVDSYSYQKRKTKRHGWQTEKYYDRLNHSRHSTIREKDIPLPQAIRNEAYDKFIKQVKIGFWSETRRGKN